MIKKLQKKYALSEQGAKDLIKGCLACVLQNLSFMFPVGLLYYLVSDLMNGGVPGGKIPFYVAGCVEFPIVKDTTPNMMNPRLYTTSYNKPQGQQFDDTAVLSFIKLQYT